MWCHLLLMMPLFGLGLFLVLPWPVALPLYLVVDALSLILYAKIRQGMRQPVRTGREGMQGGTVTVVHKVTPQGGQVRYHNELWDAVSQEWVPEGDQARIVGMRGMQLVVQSVSKE